MSPPDDDKNEDHKIEDTLENASFPSKAVEGHRGLFVSLFVVIFIWLSVFITLIFYSNSVVELVPQSEKFYKILGVSVKKTGISLVSPFLEESRDANGNRIIFIQGTIMNTHASDTLDIPPLQITLRDKANFIVKEFIFEDYTQKKLKPGGIEDFSYRVEQLPKNVIDIGVALSHAEHLN
ncbi:MAG: hypothetical protein AAF621_05890 [Pseudomonadota bacterium]